MKIIKQSKQLALLYFLFFFLGWLLIQNPVRVDAAVTSSNWYNSVLSNPGKSYTVKNASGTSKTIKPQNYSNYKILDVNGDGIKELFLSTQSTSIIGGNDSVVMMCWYKNKVVPVRIFTSVSWASLSYKSGYLCNLHTTAGQWIYDIYKLTNGQLKKIVRIEKIFFGGKYTYKKNNAVCTKKTFDNCFSKYANGTNISYGKVMPVIPKLNVSSKTLNVGQTYTLKVKNTSAFASWKSSNTSVVKLISTGKKSEVKIKGLKAGTATITVTVNGLKSTCKVEVLASTTLKVAKITKKIKNSDYQQYSVISGKTSSGTTVWTYTTAKYNAVEPATNCLADSQYVYIMMNGNTYVRLNKQTGKVITKANISEIRYYGAVMCLDTCGNLYVINKYDDNLVKINGSGVVVWKHKLKLTGGYIQKIIRSGNYLYLYSSLGQLIEKVNINTGK